MGLLNTCDGVLHPDTDKSDTSAHSGRIFLRSTKAPTFEAVGLRRCVTCHPDTSESARTTAESGPRFLP